MSSPSLLILLASINCPQLVPTFCLRRMPVMLLLYASVAWLLPAVCWSAYSIPADAIRIGAEELTADQLPFHLRQLMTQSSSNTSNNVYEEADDHHLPTSLSRLDALLNSAEERKRNLESSGRLLSVNRGGYFRGLLIVWVPVSFLLPTLARHKPLYHYRRGRMGHIEKPSHELSWKLNENNYDPTSADYFFEENYGPLLSRLEGYFSLLGIEELACRWKLLCHAGRQPDEFQPLSSLFKRLFERSQAFPRPETYHPALKKFFTYVWAEKKGRRFSSPVECDQENVSCPNPVHQLIRTDMLLFWQKLSKRFAIQLQDE